MTESTTTGDGIKCYGMFWDNNSEIPIHYPFRLGKSSGNERLMIKTASASVSNGAVQGLQLILVAIRKLFAENSLHHTMKVLQ